MEKNNQNNDKTSLKKVNNYLLVDVETCDNSQTIMELSFLVVNKLLAKSKEECYIIKEVWENEQYRQGEYAIGKLAHWQEMIDTGKAKVLSIYKIYDRLNKLIVDKNITIFSAYNVNFDFRAIKKTYHRFGIDKRKDYQESNKIATLDKFCLWDYAKKIYCTKDYVKWAIENNKYTPKSKLKSSAESVYQYLVEKTNFAETHFGIEDLQIEYTILITSIIQNTLDRNNALTLNKNGSWQTIEQYRKELRTKGVI